MKKRPWLGSLALAWLLTLLVVVPALAAPPLPSSFYGVIKVDGGNVPDGIVVRALVDGEAYAETRTQTYEGKSVYSLDVLGDDTDSAARDGGHEGDQVQFEIGGILAAETGVWHGGTNVQLDLTAAGKPAAAPPTVAPQPTQTPLVSAQAASAANPTPAQPAQAGASSASQPGGGQGGLIGALAAIVVVAAAGTVIVRRRK